MLKTKLEKELLLVNLKRINYILEENDYSSWHFDFEEEKDQFFLSIFDEHNPQEELIFTVTLEGFVVRNGYRYKKDKRNPVREEHPAFIEAEKILELIKNHLQN